VVWHEREEAARWENSIRAGCVISILFIGVIVIAL